MAENPTIVDRAADAAFLELLRRTPESSEWEARYVEHEWSRFRHVFQPGICELPTRRVLEFGCNIAASSIVMALCGSRVTACDISEACLALGQLNVRRYGLANAIQFVRVQEGASLPFANGCFDLITCNSVLEYVKAGHLRNIQQELDRVLRPAGHIVIFGTSNRMWPVEAHSRRWLVNYVPERFDRLFRRHPQRGIWPWQIRSGFGAYEDVLGQLGSERYLRARSSARDSLGKRFALALASRLCGIVGLSPGYLTPYMFAILRKPLAEPAR